MNLKNFNLARHWNVIFVLILPLLCYCGSGDELAKEGPPAKVENAVKESSLTTLTLSPEAEERLGIEIFTTEKKNIPIVMKLGGEIIVPPGFEAKVAAPVAGTVINSKNGNFLKAGSVVKKGQEIMRLLLMPPGKDLIGAREEVIVKQAQYEVAQEKWKRAEQLLKDKGTMTWREYLIRGVIL